MSRLYTLVWIVGVLGLVLLVGLGGRSVAAQFQWGGPTSLQIGKPSSSWPTSISGTRSRVIGTYDDGSDRWSVYVRYLRCPVTARGAFRVTVYQDHYKWNTVGQGSWVADLSKPAVPYSQTAVDFRRSDSVLYTWAAHRESSWQVHLQVPSAQGCARWTFGSETN